MGKFCTVNTANTIYSNHNPNHKINIFPLSISAWNSTACVNQHRRPSTARAFPFLWSKTSQRRLQPLQNHGSCPHFWRWRASTLGQKLLHKGTPYILLFVRNNSRWKYMHLCKHIMITACPNAPYVESLTCCDVYIIVMCLNQNVFWLCMFIITTVHVLIPPV